jgi:hypothetical protein
MEHNPLWMLMPWAVFALAVGVKFWRITAVFRRRNLASTEQARQALERIWSESG